MGIAIVDFNQATFTSGFAWDTDPYTAGTWVLSITGLDGGANTTALRNPGADNGDPNWQLLTVVDAGPNLPAMTVWARKVTKTEALHISVPGQNGTDTIGVLYALTGLRDSPHASDVFSVGSSSSGTSDTSQMAPYYAPDGTETVIGVWYSGAVTNYTLGGLTARAELDGSSSTVRSGEKVITTAGPSSLTATSSAGAPWVALTIAAREDPGTSVTFPNEPLKTTIELALGANPNQDPAYWAGLWTDVTDYAYTRDKVLISRGRQDEASSANPSSMTVTLDNTDGRFTRLNPNSPYYGLLNKNTPMRLWVDAGNGPALRYTGFVSEWPPRSQGSEIDEHMPIRADGTLRRLSKGQVVKSALFGTILDVGGASGYWPLETGGFSGLPNGTDMVVRGTATFSGTSLPGSAGSVTVPIGSSASAPTTGMPDTSCWQVSFWLEVQEGTTDVSPVICWTTTGSTFGRWIAYANSPSNVGVVSVEVTEQNNATTVAVVGITDVRGVGPILVTIFSRPSGGGNTIVNVYLNGVLDNSSVVSSDIVSPITAVGINNRTLASGLSIGGQVSHLHVSANATGTLDPVVGWIVDAGLGHPGERACDRIRRISSENGILVPIVGDDGTSELMGPQPVGDFVTVLHDCEETDGGYLYELKDGRLGYQTRSDRYNKVSALSLDYPSGHLSPPLEPTDDDQHTLNDFIATRSGGGSARAFDQNHIDSVGLYPDAKDTNVFEDDQLPSQAGWRVHLGTAEGLRFPAISPNLMLNPELIPDWSLLDVGQLSTLTDPGRDLPPGQIDVFVEGYSEEIDTVSWVATANCSPADPWRVGVTDDMVLGHVDTDGSSLTAPLGVPGVAPTTLSEDFEDTTYNVTITNGGNASWARSNTTSHSGSWSFKAGTITDNQTSDAAVTVPAGYKTLLFWFKVSSEYTFDFLRVLVDGVEKAAYSGEVDWGLGAVNVSGATTVTFRYSKDAFSSSGLDTAFIDDLLFTTPETMSVRADVGSDWTTYYGDLTFDATVAGEQMTVVGITAKATLNPDPGFNTVVAWSASGGTFTATGVGQLTPNGTSGTVQVFSTPRVNVTAGGGYTATTLLQDSVSRSVNFVVNWYNASNSLVSSSTKATSLAANVLTSVSMDLVAPAGATKAEIGATMTGTPPATNVLFLDEMYLIQHQVFSVIRSVNGISKAHSSGEDVRLTQSSIVSM